MAHRSIHTGLAILVALTLPIGTALAQGGAAPADPAAARPVGTTGIGNAGGSISPSPGGTTTAPSAPLAGPSLPPAPSAVQGFAEQEQISPTGRSVAGPDGSTKIVPARPCSVVARETDGTTTCVGIPGPR